MQVQCNTSVENYKWTCVRVFCQSNQNSTTQMFVTCISNVKGLTGDLQTLCHVTCVLLHLEMGSGDVSRGEQSLTTL